MNAVANDQFKSARLMTIRQLTAIFQVTRRTIMRWCENGEFPAPIQIGGTKRWHAEGVERVLVGMEAADAAEELNQAQDAEPGNRLMKATSKSAHSDRVSEDFNAKASWDQVLTPHGWNLRDRDGAVDHWCRPGKHDGTSATTNHNGNDMLFVFSSNAGPFQEGKSYDKFAAYAILNHSGDFSKAARELSKNGYGKASLKSGRR